MHFLYSEKNLSDLSGQLRRRLILLGIGLLLSLLLLVWLLFQDNHRDRRPELAVMLLLIVSMSGAVFCYDLLIRPVRAYVRHLTSSLHGRVHDITVVFDRVGLNQSVVDGVAFRDLIFLGEPDRHGDRERLFYWDAACPLPEFEKGQEVTLRYYDRFITAYLP